MSLKNTLQDCLAYRFSARLQEGGMRQTIKEQHMRDKISALASSDDGPEFIFFTDWSILVIDDENLSFLILEKETIYRMLIDLHPFDQDSMVQVNESELEANH